MDNSQLMKLKEVEVKKLPTYWVAKAGQDDETRINISDMSDGHIEAALVLIRRKQQIRKVEKQKLLSDIKYLDKKFDFTEDMIAALEEEELKRKILSIDKPELVENIVITSDSISVINTEIVKPIKTTKTKKVK